MIPHHEFWNPNILLATTWPHYLWNMIIQADPTYFTAANPAIEDAGFFGEKKSDILDLIPDEYKPHTRLIHFQENNPPIVPVQEFPLIAKPNVGERGEGVKKINSQEELDDYHNHIQTDYLIQQYVDYPAEYGVLYYRMPDGSEEGISSLTKKEFLTITGDGHSSSREILQNHPRYYRYIDFIDPSLLEMRPESGQEVLLQPIGNHSRGTIFRDARNLITPELVNRMRLIADAIPGFYYGRFDLRAPSDESLARGENLMILELNGITSDPAHIFDPEYPLRQAIKDIRADAKLISRIAKQNKKRGVHTTPLRELAKKTWQFYFKK